MKDVNKPFFAAIGQRVKQRRSQKKWTREDLADSIGVTDKFIYDIEVGNKGMSLMTLQRLGQALEVSTDWLLSGEDFKK